MPSIDIVITSFNGKDLLAKQLPVVIKNSPDVNQIIIVDDASSDGTVEYLSENFPKIKCISNISNRGFTKSTNIGVEQSRADFVVLLNNDVYPETDYLRSAVKYFEDPKVFAVTFNEANSSWPLVYFEGKIQYIRGKKSEDPFFSAWASGGSCIVRRNLWHALGGYNPVYSPGYWEDIDIGWRAWRMGYKIVWDPNSKVEHKHETTFSKLSPTFVSMIKQRNELLFNWLNITDSKLLLDHLRFLLLHTLSHPGYLKVILSALGKYKSNQRLKNTPFSDGYILHTVNRPYHD